MVMLQAEESDEKDGVGEVEESADLVMFCHRLSIIDKKDFQNLRHVELHLRFLATLLLSRNQLEQEKG